MEPSKSKPFIRSPLSPLTQELYEVMKQSEKLLEESKWILEQLRKSQAQANLALHQTYFDLEQAKELLITRRFSNV